MEDLIFTKKANSKYIGVADKDMMLSLAGAGGKRMDHKFEDVTATTQPAGRGCHIIIIIG